MKPMLATPYDTARVINQLPLYIQPKIDGIRMLVKDGVGLSRSLKPIPNKFIQSWVKKNSEYLQGLDGELVIGDPTADDVYKATHSGVMTHSGEPNFTFIVFDCWDEGSLPYAKRLNLLRAWETLDAVDRVIVLESSFMGTLQGIDELCEEYLDRGYEGAILRDPAAEYKFGRATPARGQLIKMKLFIDMEAEVTGFAEKMHNANEAVTNELGYTTHTSHKENLVPMNTLGALICKGNFPDGTPFKVRVGTGFSDADRKEIWDNRESYSGRIAKFKYTPIGTDVNPRHPVFLGWRAPEDMS